jgi:hypothetical protein
MLFVGNNYFISGHCNFCTRLFRAQTAHAKGQTTEQKRDKTAKV